MRRTVAQLLVGLCCAAALSGCGSSSPAALPAGSLLGAPVTARLVLARMRQALAPIHSLTAVAVQHGSHRDRDRVSMTAALQLPDRMSITYHEHGWSIWIRVIGHGTWARYSDTFWTTRGVSAPAAQILATRWYILPASTFGDLVGQLSKLTRSTLVPCLITDGMSPLHLAGSGTVDGVAAIRLRERGTEPGTAPGYLWVSANPPYLPLRSVQTGPGRAHGRPRPRPECGETSHDATESEKGPATTLSYGSFNDPLHITAPRHPFALPQVAAHAA